MTCSIHMPSFLPLSLEFDKWNPHKWDMSKLGLVGGRFGDYYCEDCDNLSCANGHNQLTSDKRLKGYQP